MSFGKDVERYCELGRQLKALEAERAALGAELLEEMDADGVQRWEDDYLLATVVEQPGREMADVKALREAGLHQFLKQGNPSRYVLARRK